MTRRRKAFSGVVLVSLVLAATAAPAAANDGVTVRADEDPNLTASAKLHLDSGAPTKETISVNYPN